MELKVSLRIIIYYCSNFAFSLLFPPLPSPPQLLEQALAVEEQLHRASNAGLVQDPNHSVMQLHSRYTDLDCLADGHVPLVAECLKHKKNSILLMKKGWLSVVCSNYGYLRKILVSSIIMYQYIVFLCSNYGYLGKILVSSIIIILSDLWQGGLKFLFQLCEFYSSW